MKRTYFQLVFILQKNTTENTYSTLMSHMNEEERMKVEEKIDLFTGGYHTVRNNVQHLTRMSVF